MFERLRIKFRRTLDHAQTRAEYLEEQRQAGRRNRIGAAGKIEELPPGRGTVDFYDEHRPR